MARDWYRSTSDGQRAYREVRDGVDVVVFDRASQEITRRFDERQWVPDSDARPLNRMALAQIAFAADAVLCRSMGMYQKENDWLMLRDAQRIAWMNDGPQRSYVRRTLYEYIMAAVGHLGDVKDPPVPMGSVSEILGILQEERGKPGKKPKVVQRMLAALEGEDGD